MSELVTFMKKIMTMLSEKQKAVEELLMILLFTSIIFSIEGFLDGKLISRSNELNMIIEHAKKYWIVLPILIVFIVIFIYIIIRNKYLKRIINYPAFTFKFDRWIISIILSIVLYWSAVHFGLLQGSLIVPTKILDGALLTFYLLVFILRKKKLSLECNKKEENEEELDEQSYSSDIAIKESKDDMLNRTEFAKRLVASVNSWKEEESIVIGLYGEWGTGKTSVLNLMQEGFNKKQNTIIVPFNPWYFKDEEQLILQFFNKLVTEIEKNFSGEKSKLISNIKAYSQKITSVTLRMGVVNFSFKDFLGKKEENNDIFSLKKNIEEQLERENKRIIVLIDDIDRLDDKEIHSVFKLVKAIADFHYTTYILAFDEEIVTQVLSTQYSGKQSSNMGQSFLEKIIQVPLYLPPVDQIDIQNILFEEIQKVLEKNQIFLPDDERTRFEVIWESSIGSFPLTVRAVKRYQNSIVFSLPLVKGEVNIVDFLCIEGMRVFLPDIYKFIYKHGDAFLTAGESKTEGFSEEYSPILEIVFKDFTTQEKKSIEFLIYELFPRSKYLFTGEINNKRLIDKKWALEKKICSTDYFNKYFVYSVRDGQISDKKFNNLLYELKNVDSKSVVNKTQGIISVRNYSNFIRKVQMILDELEPKQAENLIKCLVELEESIPAGGNGYMSNQLQTAVLISRLLKLLPEGRREDVIKIAIQSISSLLFSVEILKYLEQSSKSEPILKLNEMERVAFSVIERIKQEINIENFLDIYGVHSSTILLILCKFGNNNHKNELAINLAKWVKEQDGVEKLLIGFAQKSYNPKSDRYHFSKFDVGSYLKLEEVVGKEGIDSIVDIIENKYLKEFLYHSEYVGTTDFEWVAFAFWDEYHSMLEARNQSI
ncbi:KAP family P-loop NTPase fold protein [Bacillus nitratireducens]|uniref:KAP family P-loop NTPase fold protein n=1 Tax=Bacillus nitratireducens TaxID=2026193 RepID=UPI000BF2BC75|nr:P-loop NTPase fold protein [Bacillus nitratireducens]PFI43002.1 NTPase KAP [Bacillus cereus]